MAQVDVLDLTVLVVILLGTALYFFRASIFGSKEQSMEDKYKNGFGNSAATLAGSTRDIVEALEKNGKDVIIFYGSQTGTAEDYASRLSKEASQVYGLKSMVASVEDYDFENLDAIPEDKVVGFVMATYGEGEPTDSAFSFYEFITGEDVEFSKGSSLSNLKYVVFGLGNSTYEHYNSVGKKINSVLGELGATRLGPYGEGDDGSGTMEEDYLAWKDELFDTWKTEQGLEVRDAVYEPVLNVSLVEDLTTEDETVYLGEPNKAHLMHNIKAPYTTVNPKISSVVEARELFQTPDRNCVHLELDAEGMKYKTGDHLALITQNSDDEVDRFLTILNLKDKRDEVIDVSVIDPTAKVPFPVPTTYDAIVRYHLEINGPVSRQFMSSIAPFAPFEEAKKNAQRLGSSKDEFATEVSKHYLNISRILSDLSGGKPWAGIPFSFIIESVPHLVPRYYSISSSARETPDKISITAVVESIKPTGSTHVLKGVATNYILDIMHHHQKTKNPDPSAVHYKTEGPRNVLGGESVYTYVRHSNFKLPSNLRKPIIMIGPGTGVAPFRAFVRERAFLAQQGNLVGPAVLFFGCRNSKEDFIYQDEWAEFSKNSPKDLLATITTSADEDGKPKGFDETSFFSLFTAFSRETSKKVYVQHRLEENCKLINTLIKQGAFFYVCGDAQRMARDVQATLVRIIAKERDISLSKGEEIVKNMKVQNLYQEDVW